MAPAVEPLRAAFLEHVAEIFAEATLTMPSPDAWMQRGGKQGRHSEHLGFILAEMQFLQRAYPGAALVMSCAGRVSVEQVWAWLGEVADPEIPVISIVDLGIVRDVRAGRRRRAWSRSRRPIPAARRCR